MPAQGFAGQVDVAFETDRGLLVAGLHGAGYRVDALVLTNLLRTDGDRQRPLPNDSHEVEAIAVLARAHQDANWTGQRDANRLRALREFFPATVAAIPRLSTRSALTARFDNHPGRRDPT